ncbi:MAG TPA: ribosome maturation factor RimM [Acidimicrobiia bacterium]
MAGPLRLEVGRIGRAHGLRGEVGVTLGSDRVDRLAPGSVLYADGRRLVVEQSRPHAGRWLVSFEGVQDRTDAEALRGVVLSADARPSDGDELWVHELIGAAVRDRAGRELGPVVAVESNPASDLLVLDGDVLVPMTFIVEQGPGFVVVDPPEGLLDVNRRD